MMVLLLLYTSVLIAARQEREGCSAEALAVRVAEAYDSYSGNVSSEDDLEMSLNRMTTLTQAVGAIHDECNDARYQAYVEEGTALLENLRAGGYILYVRHTKTDSSQEDTDMSSCETQRNLNEQGRLDAAMIGQAWTTLALPVDQLISTEFCRTRDTALIAFGDPTIITRADLETMLDELLAIPPAEGTNTVIVGHVDLLEAATGIQIPEAIRFDEGDALIYRPLGGAMGDAGYKLEGRISLRNWGDLARIASEQAD